MASAQRIQLGSTIVLLTAATAVAGPVMEVWPADGPDDTVAVSAAALAGWYAAADSFEDSVEIRDVHQNLIAAITRGQITALLAANLLFEFLSLVALNR